MSIVSVFDFGNNVIRFVDDKPVANDIAKALGYANPSTTVSEKVKEKNRSLRELRTEAGMRQVTVLEEAGIYQLIFSSKLPAAEAFQDWVFSEVLPSIRKTGTYSIPQPGPAKYPASEASARNRQIAGEVKAIDEDLSKKFPRLAQLLIDDVVMHLTSTPSLDETVRLSGVEKADKLGYKTDNSSRVKLGKYLAECGLNPVKETRFCMGAMREINAYLDNDELTQAVNDYFLVEEPAFDTRKRWEEMKKENKAKAKKAAEESQLDLF